jgi:hypothetical protein
LIPLTPCQQPSILSRSLRDVDEARSGSAWNTATIIACAVYGMRRLLTSNIDVTKNNLV